MIKTGFEIKRQITTVSYRDRLRRHNWHIYGRNVWSKVQSSTKGRLKLLLKLLSKGLDVQGCSILNVFKIRFNWLIEFKDSHVIVSLPT